MTFDIFLGKSSKEWLDIEDEARHLRAKTLLLMDKIDELKWLLEKQEKLIESLATTQLRDTHKEPELLRITDLMFGCVNGELKLVAPHNRYTHWASAQIDGYDVQLFAQEQGNDI